MRSRISGGKEGDIVVGARVVGRRLRPENGSYSRIEVPPLSSVLAFFDTILARFVPGVLQPAHAFRSGGGSDRHVAELDLF
jgi:hypothetical protein